MARMSAGVRKPATPHERIDRLANQLDRLEKALMGAAMVSDLNRLRLDLTPAIEDLLRRVREGDAVAAPRQSVDALTQYVNSIDARITKLHESHTKQINCLFARTGKKNQAEQLALPFEGMTIEVGFKPRKKD